MADLKIVIENKERGVLFVQVFAVADYSDENDMSVHNIKTKDTYENINYSKQ